MNESCPDGKEIRTKERCKEVLKYSSFFGVDNGKGMEYKLRGESTWGNRPLQCSIRKGNRQLFYNQRESTSNQKLHSGEFVMVCEKGNVFTSYFHLERISNSYFCCVYIWTSSYLNIF